MPGCLNMQAAIMRYSYFQGAIRRELFFLNARHLFALTCLPAQNIHYSLISRSEIVSLYKLFRSLNPVILYTFVRLRLCPSIVSLTNQYRYVLYKYIQLSTGNNKCWMTELTCFHKKHQCEIVFIIISHGWTRSWFWENKTAIYKGKERRSWGQIVANGELKSHLGRCWGPDDLGSCE